MRHSANPVLPSSRLYRTFVATEVLILIADHANSMVAVVVVIFNAATVVLLLAMMPSVVGLVLARSTIELHPAGAHLQAGCVIALPLPLVVISPRLGQSWRSQGSAS